MAQLMSGAEKAALHRSQGQIQDPRGVLQPQALAEGEVHRRPEVLGQGVQGLAQAAGGGFIRP